MTTMSWVAPVSDRAARAHAQKNCLSIILAVASLVAPELSESDRERMARLRAAANRIADLLNEDLDETANDATTGEVDVERLFSVVCGSLRDRADAAHVALVVKCHGGHVRGVERELHEALFNLIANALEATPPGRAVFVDADLTPDGGHLWTIHDSGPGMKREVFDHIGTPHRKVRPGGSGLGVALASAVVAKLGGTLEYDTAPGRGTTVAIRLPREARVELPR
jgi:two-component system phosphate regulon sensor histidine kinase PhoR